MSDPVIVAGAGAAGLLFASRIRSVDVVIVSPYRPGWPPHCTGIVSPSTASRLGVGEAVSETYECSVFADWRGVEFCRVCGKPLAVRIDRPRFEDILVLKVEELGHRIVRGRVEGWRTGRGFIEVLVSGHGMLRGRLLVNAMGALEAPRGCRLAIGVEVKARLSRRVEPEAFTTYHLVNGVGRLFGWLVPLSDGREVLIGAAGPAATVWRGFENTLRIVDKCCGVASMTSRRSGILVLGPPLENPFDGDRVVRIGDAACLSKPFTGGGLYAISRVAPALADAVETGDWAKLLTAWSVIADELRRQYSLVRVYEALTAFSRRFALAALSLVCSCTPDFDEHSRGVECIHTKLFGWKR